MSRVIGHATLWVLASIHLVLPFTPANSHSEPHIRVAAVLIGVVFVGLALLARWFPGRAKLVGLLFFLLVSSVAALTGRSPLAEGLAIKLFFAGSLLAGAIVGPAVDRPPSSRPTPG